MSLDTLVALAAAVRQLLKDVVWLKKKAEEPRIVYVSVSGGESGSAKTDSYCLFGGFGLVDANPLIYCNMMGWLSSNVEVDVQNKLVACTIKRIRLNVYSNALVNDAVITLRKNGAGTTLQLTIPAGATGHFEKAVDVEFIDGDLASWKLETTCGELVNNLYAHCFIEVINH